MLTLSLINYKISYNPNVDISSFLKVEKMLE